MFAVIMVAILAILSAAGFAVARTIKPNEEGNSSRGSVRLASIGAAVLAVVILLSSSVTVVAPRTVGVKVAFGKPTGVLSNGLHLKAPWEKVEDLDGSVQNDVYQGADHDIDIRLGNNSKATADASIQWQLKTDDAEDLFLNYKTFDNIRTNLVDRNFRAALNEVMATYNPLNSVKAAEGGADLNAMAKQVEAKMKERVGDQIEVKSVTIPLINFDQSTQDRINELQSEIARTRIAEQKKATNKAEAEANKILEQSVSENTLTSKCLDIVSKSGQSPLGCFPGTSALPTVTQPQKK
ncbi:SPFH domain-containing protein [Falsarthrobacter nasiphocae]|uniref:Regulator of protease activity HflC (Stomatin/prohibitin superfamily) n=1 Tax=Falsarthrobacter nasiphocae TaxID=189863 RepID=A0AAE4C4U7_9MICC|nr:SPFH domain-containing protein [Falsarthrobacter nasiphocae]MDR6891726.1 regulator of protease activity HflC (stomatin/prohibitin superfamily) [Falsarthrobacter nasiphocae]